MNLHTLRESVVDQSVHMAEAIGVPLADLDVRVHVAEGVLHVRVLDRQQPHIGAFAKASMPAADAGDPTFVAAAIRGGIAARRDVAKVADVTRRALHMVAVA
jgi:hypothetical protein